MPFESYPATLYAKVLETGETVRACGATFAANQELAHVILSLYIKGTLAGTEQLRVRLYHDAALTKLYASTSWVTLASVVGAGAAWIGKVVFSFATLPHIEAGRAYYVSVESQNYTRNGETLYISCLYDWPIPVNTNSDIPNYALAAEFYGYRKVRY